MNDPVCSAGSSINEALLVMCVFVQGREGLREKTSKQEVN